MLGLWILKTCTIISECHFFYNDILGEKKIHILYRFFNIFLVAIIYFRQDILSKIFSFEKTHYSSLSKTTQTSGPCWPRVLRRTGKYFLSPIYLPAQWIRDKQCGLQIRGRKGKLAFRSAESRLCSFEFRTPKEKRNSRTFARAKTILQWQLPKTICQRTTKYFNVKLARFNVKLFRKLKKL